MMDVNIRMDILTTLFSSLKESLVITLIVLFLMIVIELVVLKYKHKIIKFVRKNKFL